MPFYESFIRPLAFHFDPEWVHENVMKLIRCGIFDFKQVTDQRLEQEINGIRFANPIGLAAGFDKNAEALEAWENIGFGYAEVGTVTYLPQPGNPRPRLFRLPEDKAIVNRMGFNNGGAEAMAARLTAAHPTIPIGINLGKNKTIELEDAPKNYARSYRLLHELGDYFVINVSSPNTPGLRQLQEKAALSDIVCALQDIDNTRPLFIKVAPDLEISALDEVVEVAHEHHLAGLVATNTTISRPSLKSSVQESGGLSGAPLKPMADSFMRHLYRSCNKEMTLIGVGGITDGNDAFDRIASGAHLCQIYTGWIYGGPTMVIRSLAQLINRMEQTGIRSIGELRGTANN